jgi:hypothetical protein
LVAGAAGRLGEAVLSEVLAAPRYRHTTVLTTAPLGSTLAGLQGLSLEQLGEFAAARASEAGVRAKADQPELDVFVIWGDAADPFGRAHNRRDAVYAPVQDAQALRAVAAAASELRARRLLLVAPLLAWQQLSAASRMLPEAMELELARLPIPTIVIMRPTSESVGRDASGGSRLQRFARFYLSQLRFMLPTLAQTLRSGEIARAAVSLIADARAPGLAVVALEEIRHHAGKPRTEPAAPWARKR